MSNPGLHIISVPLLLLTLYVVGVVLWQAGGSALNSVQVYRKLRSVRKAAEKQGWYREVTDTAIVWVSPVRGLLLVCHAHEGGKWRHWGSRVRKFYASESEALESLLADEIVTVVEGVRILD